jgi:hypothetical protein
MDTDTTHGVAPGNTMGIPFHMVGQFPFLWIWRINFAGWGGGGALIQQLSICYSQCYQEYLPRTPLLAALTPPQLFEPLWPLPPLTLSLFVPDLTDQPAYTIVHTSDLCTLALTSRPVPGKPLKTLLMHTLCLVPDWPLLGRVNIGAEGRVPTAPHEPTEKS